MYSMIKILGGIIFFFGSVIGCSFAEQEGSVSDNFNYPDSPTMIEYEKMRIAHCLCGVVQNPVDDELKDVLVELNDEKTNQRINATFSTSTGQFYLDNVEAEKGPFLLKFSKPGYNTVLLRVLLDQDTSQELKITLQFS